MIAVLLVASTGFLTVRLHAVKAARTSSVTLRVFPTSVLPGDALTVAADNLPLGPGHQDPDQFCMYLVGAGPYALARQPLSSTFAPDYPRPVTTQPDPSLTPGGVRTSGVGSFVVPVDLPAGQYTLYVALCQKGAVPTILAPLFAQARITVPKAPAAIVAAAHSEHAPPTGRPITVSLRDLNVNGDTCLFFTSVDRLSAGGTWTGKQIPPGAHTFQLPLPSGTPAGRYQIFITSRSPDGPCPASRLTAAHLLASTALLVAGRSLDALRVNAQGTRMRTSDVVRIEVQLASGVAPGLVCFATIRQGRTPQPLHTISASAFSHGRASVEWSLGSPGTVTVIATLGGCSYTPQAYSTVIIGVQ